MFERRVVRIELFKYSLGVICSVSYYEKNLTKVSAFKTEADIHLAKENQFNVFENLILSIGKDHNWLARISLSKGDLRKCFFAQNIWFIKKRNEIAGFAEIGQLNERQAQLNYFGIIPKYRKSGLGKSLIEYVLNELSNRGFESLTLRTCEFDDPGAINLYRRLGFKKIKETQEDISIE